MGVVKAQRRRLVPEPLILDQKVESPLGIYRLKGWIGEHHYQAGRELARIVAAVRRDDDSPSEDAKNRVLANLMPGDGGRGVAPELLYTHEELRRRREERRRIFYEAYKVLRGEGLWVFDTVYTVAIRERGIVPEKLDRLRLGLQRLAEHFRFARPEHAAQNAP